MDTSVEDLANIAMNQLVNVKELCRTVYRAEHMGEDTSSLLEQLKFERRKLNHFIMAWGYAAEQEYLEKVEDV